MLCQGYEWLLFYEFGSSYLVVFIRNAYNMKPGLEHADIQFLLVLVHFIDLFNLANQVKYVDRF